MKICVLGAGALGCAIGAALAEGGSDVWLLNRSKAHVDAMKAGGLTIVTTGGERRVPVQAAARAEVIGPVDLVIVLVKSFHTRDAIAGAQALIGAHTAVLSLQNGLGHEDILAEAVGRHRVLAGKTYVGGVLLAPGRIMSGTAGKHTYIGELDGAITDRVRQIAGVFNAAGLATSVSDNIVGTMWDKLLVNVATGALSGITRLAAVDAVGEALDVARAAGIRLSFTDPVQAWDRAAEGLPPDFKASMLQSLEKGSITEVDFINGAVVRWGRRLGVATPVNAALVACIKGIELSLAAH